MNEFKLLKFTCPDKGFKNEAEFTTRFGKQIKDRWGFFHKISDYSLWFKPFDVIFAYKGIAWAIELKYTKHWSCTPFDMLRGSTPKKPWTQVKSLGEYQENGWKSLIIVYSSKENNYIIISFSDDERLHSKQTFIWNEGT